MENQIIREVIGENKENNNKKEPKKEKIIIIVLIIIIVVLCLAFLLYYLKTNSNESLSANSSNTTSNGNVNSTSKKQSNEKNDENTFMGTSLDSWRDMIELYYGNKRGKLPGNIDVHYNDEGKLVAVVTNGFSVDAEYIFDENTGYATDTKTNKVIDFQNGKEVKENSGNKIEFSDNQCLAIAYVTDNELTNFINMYFNYPQDYYDLEERDFRYPENRYDGYGNRFVLIPKDDSVTITLYSCFLSPDGNIEKDNILFENNNKGFIVLDDYIEYTPSMIVQFECNGFEDEFPITFSGDDGSLVLSGHETEVKDISLYLVN